MTIGDVIYFQISVFTCTQQSHSKSSSIPATARQNNFSGWSSLTQEPANHVVSIILLERVPEGKEKLLVMHFAYPEMSFVAQRARELWSKTSSDIPSYPLVLVMMLPTTFLPFQNFHQFFLLRERFDRYFFSHSSRLVFTKLEYNHMIFMRVLALSVEMLIC